MSSTERQDRYRNKRKKSMRIYNNKLYETYIYILGKYLQALLDVSGLVNDKKVLNGFVAALDRKDLPAAKTGLIRAARRCCSSEDVELVEDLLAALPAFPVERQVKRARKDISCFLCGGPHYQNHCPNRGSVGRVVPGAAPVTLCPFCRKSGHSESSCWSKHPHLRPNSGSSSSSSSSACKI